MDPDTIRKFCSRHVYGKYTINDDYSIDVDGNVTLNNTKTTKLPVKFRNVSGYFNLWKNKLTTLEGCPEYCESFSCANNNLTNLIGSPKRLHINGMCRVVENPLLSLEGIMSGLEDDQLQLPQPFTFEDYISEIRKAKFEKIKRNINGH